MRRRKSRKAKPISELERQRRTRQRQQSLASLTNNNSAPLLHTRKQASVLLGGVSVSSLIRLERSGRLKPIKLNPSSPNAQTFYARSDLLKLVKDARAVQAEAQKLVEDAQAGAHR